MIFCDKPYCLNSNGEYCYNSNLFIDNMGNCSSFEDYRDRDDYQTQFFVAVNRSGIVGKKRLNGKQITHRGYVFFTQDNALTLDREQLNVTEERTGLHCGTIKQIDDNWDRFLEMVPGAPCVDQLPEVKEINSKGDICYVETPTAAEMLHAQIYIDWIKSTKELLLNWEWRKK